MSWQLTITHKGKDIPLATYKHYAGCVSASLDKLPGKFNISDISAVHFIKLESDSITKSEDDPQGT
jgi:hypothetical protein